MCNFTVYIKQKYQNTPAQNHLIFLCFKVFWLFYYL
jgi:hypothetical protein